MKNVVTSFPNYELVFFFNFFNQWANSLLSRLEPEKAPMKRRKKIKENDFLMFYFTIQILKKKSN